jgi:hypothetical protein
MAGIFLESYGGNRLVLFIQLSIEWMKQFILKPLYLRDQESIGIYFENFLKLNGYSMTVSNISIYLPEISIFNSKKSSP